jgi:hypothetical protein
MKENLLVDFMDKLLHRIITHNVVWSNAYNSIMMLIGGGAYCVIVCSLNNVIQKQILATGIRNQCF